ncbi:hypothetical protein EV126DRAFT_426351 [Verticillium dahliae]|nr:hypothetical protein EV126DRAFT_426351 [Verticillium dahliae]
MTTCRFKWEDRTLLASLRPVVYFYVDGCVDGCVNGWLALFRITVLGCLCFVLYVSVFFSLVFRFKTWAITSLKGGFYRLLQT